MPRFVYQQDTAPAPVVEDEWADDPEAEVDEEEEELSPARSLWNAGAGLLAAAVGHRLATGRSSQDAPAVEVAPAPAAPCDACSAEAAALQTAKMVQPTGKRRLRGM